MIRPMRWILFLGVLGAGTAFVLTRPAALPAGALDGLTGDPARGALVFAAAGCASCHTAPGAAADGAPVLAGGQRFASEFGTFVAPNISPDPEQGIGGWTDAELVRAIMLGVSPGGAHYYPAFPYAAYGKADVQDVMDLIAHLRSLPPSDVASLPNEITFPFSIRRGVGLWKARYVTDDWTITAGLTPEAERGRYLAEALGHCAECHTPRDAFGGLDRDRWLAGAPNPSGEGRIPDITPAGLAWSETEIAEYLKSGFTPEFDTAGGSMAPVVRSLALLPDADRAAIAAYLKAVPPMGD